jgi:tetratricopeptide (TPR) repeat protein
LTALLRHGQSAEQAFTNAFQVPLPTMENELRRYLNQGKFEPLALSVRASLMAAQPLSWRRIGPAETCFRLGNELLRVGRLESAEAYFLHGKAVAPASPLPYEGLGILAAERGDQAAAIASLSEAFARGSTNFLAHYVMAREKFRLSQKRPNTYSRLAEPEAEEIRTELEKTLALMPDFGPAHHLLGFFELVQGQDPSTAEQHLQRAIQLEPENQSYSLTLAQAQLFRNEFDAARTTLQALCVPNVDAPVRQHAQEMLNAVIDQEKRR